MPKSFIRLDPGFRNQMQTYGIQKGPLVAGPELNAGTLTWSFSLSSLRLGFFFWTQRPHFEPNVRNIDLFKRRSQQQQHPSLSRKRICKIETKLSSFQFAFVLRQRSKLLLSFFPTNVLFHLHGMQWCCCCCCSCCCCCCYCCCCWSRKFKWNALFAQIIIFLCHS